MKIINLIFHQRKVLSHQELQLAGSYLNFPTKERFPRFSVVSRYLDYKTKTLNQQSGGSLMIPKNRKSREKIINSTGSF